MREIILDTETTGLNPKTGDKIVEIGCVELIDLKKTGITKQWYINPEREVPQESVAVHGLTYDFLKNYPIFSGIVDDFLDFIKDDRLVIHNASFDMGFLNSELNNIGLETLTLTRVVDTLSMARKKFPGKQASLDALCRMFGIDNTHRELHGALLDSDLLADCYIELMGGKQRGFDLINTSTVSNSQKLEKKAKKLEKRIFIVSEDELRLHDEMLKTLKEPLWLKD